MALRLLAIDAASKFGWAFGPTDGMPETGNGRFAAEGSDHEVYFAGAWRWMHGKIKEWRPDVICIEAPILPKTTTQSTVELLHGIQANLRSAAHLNHMFRVKLIHQAKVRAFFIPQPPKKKGEKRPRLTSDQMKLLTRRRCIELGLVSEDVTSLDETDATGVWAWGVHNFDPENAERFVRKFAKAA